MMRVLPLLGVSFFLALVGCSGEKRDVNEGHIVPGDSNRPVNEVTEDEWAQAGAAAQEELGALLTDELICQLGAVLASQRFGGLTCSFAYNLCTQPGSEELVDDYRQQMAESFDFSRIDMSECGASVAQVESCWSAILEGLASLSDEVTCDNPELNLTDRGNLPAECQALDEICPDVVSEVMEGRQFP